MPVLFEEADGVYLKLQGKDRKKAVKEKIHEEEAQYAILELLREEKIEEVFQYLERRPLFEEEKVEELYGEILMSAKVPKKDGKGYQYPSIGHVVGLDGKIQGDRKWLLDIVGY